MEKFKLINGSYGMISEVKRISLIYSSDNSIVIYSVREMASRIGFKETDQAMIATAASELATNILRYAGSGEMYLSILHDNIRHLNGIELFAVDMGPGIHDIELSMKERYSTQSGSLGLGLPCVQRIMDEFEIESIVGAGTRIIVRKWLKNGKY